MACPCEDNTVVLSSSPCTPTNPCNSCSGCSNCGGTSSDGCLPSSTCDKGCAAELDFRCIIYGKNGASTPNLDFPVYVGDNLETVINRLIDQISTVNPLNISGIAFDYLSDEYSINSFKDFAEAVALELKKIKIEIADLKVKTQSLTCFTFTLKNTSNTVQTFSTRDCNGTLLSNVQILPNQVRTIIGRSVTGSTGVSITNNGII